MCPPPGRCAGRRDRQPGPPCRRSLGRPSLPTVGNEPATRPHRPCSKDPLPFSVCSSPSPKRRPRRSCADTVGRCAPWPCPATAPSWSRAASTPRPFAGRSAPARLRRSCGFTRARSMPWPSWAMDGLPRAARTGASPSGRRAKTPRQTSSSAMARQWCSWSSHPTERPWPRPVGTARRACGRWRVDPTRPGRASPERQRRGLHG